MSRPRKPVIDHQPPGPNERGVKCPDCEQVWASRFMRYNGKLRCINCARAYRRSFYKGASSPATGLMPVGEVVAQLERQAWSCPLCLRRISAEGVSAAVADIDRSTGAFRGLLCSRCCDLMSRVPASQPDYVRRLADYMSGAAIKVPHINVRLKGGKRVELRDPSLRHRLLRDDEARGKLDALIQTVLTLNRRRSR